MRAIYKYPFVTDALNAPMGRVLLVAQQDDSTLPTVWIEHDTDARGDGYYFLRGTGQKFTTALNEQFVGSAICGPFVWHVYRMDTKQ